MKYLQLEIAGRGNWKDTFSQQAKQLWQKYAQVWSGFPQLLRAI
jgi:hypothetical protein